MPLMFDYRTLLIRYIDHVGECESTDFLSDFHDCAKRFSPEELTELRELSKILANNEQKNLAGTSVVPFLISGPLPFEDDAEREDFKAWKAAGKPPVWNTPKEGSDE